MNSFFYAEIEGLPEENVSEFLWSRINCCHVTYHEIVSVEACENSQHQCPVLDHNHPHTKQAVQRGQVCFWTFDSTFHLCTEMPLNSVLPHVLHNWHSASNWQCHSPQHQRNIKVESSDGSVIHNRKNIWRWYVAKKYMTKPYQFLTVETKRTFKISTNIISFNKINISILLLANTNMEPKDSSLHLVVGGVHKVHLPILHRLPFLLILFLPGWFKGWKQPSHTTWWPLLIYVESIQ